jgi:hypothetical protein
MSSILQYATKNVKFPHLVGFRAGKNSRSGPGPWCPGCLVFLVVCLFHLWMEAFFSFSFRFSPTYPYFVMLRWPLHGRLGEYLAGFCDFCSSIDLSLWYCREITSPLRQKCLSPPQPNGGLDFVQTFIMTVSEIPLVGFIRSWGVLKANFGL